jgi:predicted phosphohydrolase
MFNEQEILKMKKWSPEYKRIYQQLYYRIKTDKITALEYDIFMKMKMKIPEHRGIYINRVKSVIDEVKVDKLVYPTFKKLNKPILINFD